METCSINGCGRKHAAHGYCLMHYKRVQRHGSAEYRRGGKIVGRACAHCERPAVAKALCMRHYQMLHRHGDPLYADKRRVGQTTPGVQSRRGYIAETPGTAMVFPPAAVAPTVEKTDRPHRSAIAAQGKRNGSPQRREWQHRRIAGARRGEIVHHIDLVPTNNDPLNLHVFASAKRHAEAHRSLERVAAQLVHAGVVEFDRSSGLYRLAQSSGQATASREQP